jgi:predicted DNA-binding protein
MPTARISLHAQSILRDLAEKSGKTIQEILDEAIESYRRYKFLVDCNSAFARLKENPKAWEEEKEERRLFENTLKDGLKDE